METITLKIFTETVKEENSLIWIKPLCDFFEISVQNQHRKLKKDSILINLWIKKSTDLGEIDKNGRVLLTKKGFLRWIQTLNPSLVPYSLREKFIHYQANIFDYLFGSMEEHEMIAATNNRLQNLKGQYSQLGNQIRQTQKELQQLLNNLYQYRLPFTPVKQLPE
jgi:hypothetical protein